MLPLKMSPSSEITTFWPAEEEERESSWIEAPAYISSSPLTPPLLLPTELWRTKYKVQYDDWTASTCKYCGLISSTTLRAHIFLRIAFCFLPKMWKVASDSFIIVQQNLSQVSLGQRNRSRLRILGYFRLSKRSLPNNFLYKEGIRHFPSANPSC